MSPTEARDSVSAAIAALGFRGVLEQLAFEANQLTEAHISDKVNRARYASLHRSLVNLKDKILL